MTYEISRMYEFAASHRILNHPKCGRMHGHNYIVEVVLSDRVLNEMGMVVDFGKMDKVIKPIIEQFDHHYIACSTEDPKEYEMLIRDSVDLGADHSTAEMIARVLFEQIDHIFHTVKEVSVWETSKSRATYRR